MRSIEEFAAELVRKYPHETLAAEDFAAGEFAVAAISIIESSAVTAAEIAELKALAVAFDEVDRRAADAVLAKRAATSAA